MSLNLAISTRNAILDAIEADLGVSPIMEIRTGAKPTACSDADTGTVVATIALPADWMANASNGTKVKSGTWDDNSADAAGTAGHFRIKTSGGVVKQQGAVTVTGGGGELEVDNTVFALGQAFSVTGYTLTAPNP